VRPPEELDAVHWAGLTQAGDVPALIRALYEPGEAGAAQYCLLRPA
jgi:hypothetical protein